MVGAIADKIEGRRVQLFCVDSVDGESWCNRDVSARLRIARQVQFERYVVKEVVPFARKDRDRPHLAAVGCSFGGYHAVNMSLRHPDVFTGCLSMSGAYDLKSFGFLNGYYDDDCYFNLPMDYLPNLADAGILDCLRRNTFVLATGVHDQCWNDNERLAVVIRDDGAGIPSSHRLGSGLLNMHDRAARLSGTCTVTSGDRVGTIVRWQVPVGA